MIGHQFDGTYGLQGKTSTGTTVAFAVGHLTITEGATPIEACYVKITDPSGNVTLESALKTETFGLLISLIHEVFADAAPEGGSLPKSKIILPGK